MLKYLKAHESYVLQTLETGLDANGNQPDWESLREFHKTQIEFLQHERLVHLLVTLAIGLFFLISVFFSISLARIELFLLDALFFVLLVPYLIHYYQLENGIQRLYLLFNRLNRK